MKPPAALLLLAIAPSASITFDSDPAAACAIVGAERASIKGEEALIVWDEATKTEHFIRQAYFENAPADFGFLVPTPSRPTLADADADVFRRLFEIYKAPERQRLRSVRSDGMITAEAAAPVQLIEQKTVAGLDASVLLASDPKALGRWLADHKYPSSPALTAWLTPYVKSGAYVTAFRLSAQGGRSRSNAVRMSFAATTPFFPYAEPKGKAPSRPFRISLIAPTKMAARLGKSAWGAKVGYAAPLDASSRVGLLDRVVPADKGGASWLTVFDEPASRRGTDDLSFVAAGDDKAIKSSLSTAISP